MNRGWQAHGGWDFLGEPFPRTADGNRVEISSNHLHRMLREMYDFQWLLYDSGATLESYLVSHCKQHVVMQRQTGIENITGDYEYLLVNFQQPTAQVYETLAGIHSNPTALKYPEPHLLYIRLTQVNLHNPYSGHVEFYDPFSWRRIKLNYPQYQIYLAQAMTHLSDILTVAATAEKNAKWMSEDDMRRLHRKYISQGMLLATMFSPAHIPLPNLIRHLTHFKSFRSTWQFLTLVCRERAQELHDDALYNLYPPESFGRIWYEKPKPIDY